MADMDVIAEAVGWKPMKSSPQLDRAAVRLRFVKLFSPDAESWDEPLDVPISDAEILRRLHRMDDKGEYILNPRLIALLWANPFGIPGIKTKPKTTTDMVKAALALADKTFPPVVSQDAIAALSGMDMVAQSEETGTVAQLQAFRNHYQSIIDPLRELNDDKKTVDVRAIIAQYDEWIAYIMDLAADTEGGDRPTKEERAKAANIAVRSSKELRSASLDKEPSPLTDLYNYQRLSNELQSHCAVARLDPEKRAALELKAKHEEFFEKAERFNEICNWRTQEALHALIVAASIDDQSKMERFGLLLLKAMYLALEVALHPEKPSFDHAVLSFIEPLFIGDEAPAKIAHLKTYMEDIHPRVHAQFVAECSGPDTRQLSLSCRN